MREAGLGGQRKRGLIAAGAFALLTLLRPCLAVAAGLPENIWISTGVAFSVSFGQGIEVGLILDLRLSGLVNGLIYNPCRRIPRAGLGPYFQTGYYHRTGWRFGGGIHGGGQLFPYTDNLDGELGYTFLLRREQSAIHLGLVGEAVSPELHFFGFQLPLSVELPVSGLVRTPFFAAGLGLRAPSTFYLAGVGGCEYA